MHIRPLGLGRHESVEVSLDIHVLLEDARHVGEITAEHRVVYWHNIDYRLEILLVSG